MKYPRYTVYNYFHLIIAIDIVFHRACIISIEISSTCSTHLSESQAWRSEDEEPIEVLGDQVIWPQGAQPVASSPWFFCGKGPEKARFDRGNHGKTWCL